jgi:hypothetical protein
MTADLVESRSRHGFTQSTAAKALSLALVTFKFYEQDTTRFLGRSSFSARDTIADTASPKND